METAVYGDSEEMMKKIITLVSHWFWAIVSLLTIVLIVIFDLRIIIGLEIIQVQYIPDDAYYYLTLARNFSDMGLWTFDSGVSTATGFHLLFGYALSFLYRVLQPTVREFVLYGIMFTSIITLITSLLAWVVGLRQNKPYYLIFFTLLISSRNYTYNSLSVMEWPFVVFFAFTYVLYFYHSYKSPAKYSFFILFIIGILGSLSRSDFGLLPLSICAASLILTHYSKNWRAFLMSFSGLVGATFGVLLVFTHNYIFSGQFLQSSAKMKAYWGQLSGVSYVKTSLMIVNRLGLDSSVLLFSLFVIIILGYIMILVRIKNKQTLSIRPDMPNQFLNLILVISASLSLAGYIVIYAHGSGIRPWYTANLIVPVFILLVITANYIDDTIPSNYRKFIRLGLSIIVLNVITPNMIAIHRDLSNSPWPHQQFMLEAGKYLEQQSLFDDKIASWNAGIIGYYQGGNVINIDGLVNDDIYGYAINNELPTYIAQQNITYIIDFKKMFDDERRRLRGGYDNDIFIKTLQPIKVFDDGQYSWGYLTLYQLSP